MSQNLQIEEVSMGPPPKLRRASTQDTDYAQIPSPPPLQRSNSVPWDEVPTTLTNRFKSVIMFECITADVDYLRPWVVDKQQAHTGTGFAIDNRRIMTNTHVADNCLRIRLKKHGSSKRYAAKCVALSPDVDLALVEVTEDADEFWSDIVPVHFNRELPYLQSLVNVIGYPAGGNTICVTEGVISRVDCSNYRDSQGASFANPGSAIRIQIDAAINPGNSGGPCFDKQGEFFFCALPA